MKKKIELWSKKRKNVKTISFGVPLSESDIYCSICFAVLKILRHVVTFVRCRLLENPRIRSIWLGLKTRTSASRYSSPRTKSFFSIRLYQIVSSERVPDTVVGVNEFFIWPVGGIPDRVYLDLYPPCSQYRCSSSSRIGTTPSASFEIKLLRIRIVDVPVKLFRIADNVPLLPTPKRNWFYSRGFLRGVKTFSSINGVFCIVAQVIFWKCRRRDLLGTHPPILTYSTYILTSDSPRLNFGLG